MPTAIDQKRHQAVHEAGHAVIATTLGIQVKDLGFNEKADLTGQLSNLPEALQGLLALA